MAKNLIIRFSAIGDVAMTIPVIYSVAKAYPEDSFTVLTQTFLMPLFINHPSNVSIMGINTNTTEKSFLGYMHYVMILKKYRFDRVIDLHCVIRSHIVRLLFSLWGKKVYRIDKRRDERKLLTVRPPKEIHQLRSVISSYADVFEHAGYKYKATFVSLFDNYSIDDKSVMDMVGSKSGFWVGIAPFAKHQGKIYPLDKMEKVVETLSKQPGVRLFLFGGRGEENNVLSLWSDRYENVVNTIGLFSLDMELALISRLDVLLSMDSANMHFASLVGTKVISVWGATHPFAGFYGYNQPSDYAVQVVLPCRPCSIYGNKPCYRGDFACMTNIEPETIVTKIRESLSVS